MDKYKRKVDSIRAPEALIAATLNRIHEEEAKEAAAPQEPAAVKTFKSRRRWVGISAVAAAAAVLALVIGLNMRSSGQMGLIYGTIPDTIARSDFSTSNAQPMEREVYSAYFGMDVESLLPGQSIVKSDIQVVMENGAIICDECALTYNVEGKPLTLRLSKTQNIAPKNLNQVEPSDVDGLRVYAAVSESGKNRMAAFRQDDSSFFLTGTNMEQEQFEALLKELLQNIQK